SSAHAFANVYVTGTAYLPGSEQILYTENYIKDCAKQTRVQYVSPEGKLLAEKQLDFSRDKHAPDVSSKDFRLDSTLAISTQNNKTKVQLQRKGKRALAAAIDIEGKLVIDAGFDPFVQDQWEILLAQEEVKFRFLVPARKIAVKLKLNKRSCSVAEDRVCFRIKAANWLIAAVMAPIDLEYEKISQRLMRFTGLGQLPNDSGKGQRVDIHYRYPESDTAH
ncbi:MAG: hypothetical protein ACR2P1_11710, partial [Pseudomonadales bacterium]